MKQPCVYILASQRNGTLYTGVTSDLIKRVREHKKDQTEGFTPKYAVHILVYFEDLNFLDSRLRGNDEEDITTMSLTTVAHQLRLGPAAMPLFPMEQLVEPVEK